MDAGTNRKWIYCLSTSIGKKKRILSKLNEGEVLERFLGTKYLGQKRFSLEGGESTIPALDAMINVAANHGVQEVAIEWYTVGV